MRKLFRILLKLVQLCLLFLICIAVALSCVALLAQAVRHSPNQTWTGNFNAVIIGGSYVFVLIISLLFCVKRRLAVHLRMQRITKAHRILRRGDIPNSVHEYITQEYIRTCLVAHDSLPTDVCHPGWGRPGSKYEGVHFRRTLLDTIPEIDVLARLVMPSHPTLKPHVRMLHHFRFILPLLNSDEEEFTPLHYYDSAIQLARYSAEEPTEEEFVLGFQSAAEIKRSLNDCRLEALEPSLTEFSESTES